MTTPLPELPRYLTVAQVAAELQVCRETVYSWVHAGTITVLRLLRRPQALARPRAQPVRGVEIFAARGEGTRRID